MKIQEDQQLVSKLLCFYQGKSFRGGRKLNVLEKITSIQFSKNYFALSTTEGLIEVWSFPNFNELFEYKHSSAVMSVAFPSNENYLIFSDENKKLNKLYFKEKKYSYLLSIPFSDNTNDISSIVFKPNSEELAVGSFLSFPYIIEVKEEPKILFELKGFANTSLALTFNNQGNQFAFGNDKGQIFLFDSENYKLVNNIQVSSVEIECLIFSDDDRSLISASDGNSINMLNAKTLNRIDSVANPNFLVKALNFSSKDGILSTSTMLKTLQSWNINLKQILANRYEMENIIQLAAFNLDGSYLATVSDNEIESSSVINFYLAKLPIGHKGIIEKHLKKDDMDIPKRTCRVCGMDEWCGTDNCPLDPT